jgi:glucose-1-phosphate thymidylyltransferase
MKAVVPAAGEGTRLGTLTDDRPKPLVEVAGRPILTRVLDRLVGIGASELVVVVGYRGDEIRTHCGDSFRDVPISYVEQHERLGLAHAISRAETRIEDDFLVHNGDNVLSGNVSDVVDRQRSDADATLLVDRVTREEARETGVLDLDEDGHVRRIVEKPDDPPSTLVTTGVYGFSPAVFDACRRIDPSNRGEYELADAVTLLIEEGARVEAVELDGWRVNVNTPADVERAERLLGEER